MFKVIWELKIKFKDRDKFEHFFDPNGEWVKFFIKSPDYQGTDVLENGTGDGIYLVIDEWLSEETFNDFVKSNASEYNLLEEKAKLACRSKKRIWISV